MELKFAQFIVYMLAMTGVLVIACVVYKKALSPTFAKKLGKNLKIVDMMRLPDRKLIYIIKCRDQEFLLGSSNDKITLLSKLGYRPEVKEEIKIETDEEDNLLKKLSDKNSKKRGSV